MNFISHLKVFAHGVFPSVYERLERRHDKRANQAMNKNFHLHAPAVFAAFDAAMKESHTEYWLNFGTLLGAVREHGLIPHDNDFDVSIFAADDYSLMEQSLLRHGFTKVRQIDLYSRCGDTGGEFTYTRDGVSIDLFKSRPNPDGTVTCHIFYDSRIGDGFRLYTKVRAVTFPFEGLMDYHFLGCSARIPSNYDAYLTSHYGNWRVPDPTWGQDGPPEEKIVAGAIGIRRE